MTTPTERTTVLIERFNPEELVAPEGYAQAVSVTGGRTVHVSGQPARDVNGDIVGRGDLAAQTEQALVNVAACLKAAGASFDDVVQMTALVADWQEEKIEQVMDGVMRAAATVGAPVAATTLIPVPCLFAEGMLIEISVQAVVA